MKTIKELCEKYGIERLDSVIATVCGHTKNGIRATIDGTDGLEIFYKGSQIKGDKVLLSVSRIDENSQRIFGRFDSCDYGFAA